MDICLDVVKRSSDRYSYRFRPILSTVTYDLYASTGKKLG